MFVGCLRRAAEAASCHGKARGTPRLALDGLGSVYMYACMYVCMHVVCMPVCLHVCMSVCTIQRFGVVKSSKKGVLSTGFS